MVVLRRHSLTPANTMTTLRNVLWTWFHVVALVASTDAHTDFSPISLGIRSGLFNSHFLRRYRSSRSKVIQLSTPTNSEFGDGINSKSDDSYVGSAFLNNSPRHDTIHIQTTQSAFLCKVRTQDTVSNRDIRSTYTTELDFLEQRSDLDGTIIDSFSTRRHPNKRLHSTYFSDTMSCSSRTLAIPMATASSSLSSATAVPRPLVFWENMICGAISRSIAQTTMHPANTMKTILQNSRRGLPNSPTIRELMLPRNFRRLTVGAGANFILSVPHGAVNFAVLEFVRKRLSVILQSNPYLAANENKFSFGLDFLSSSISTVVCSVVSTPQMMITDNIMAGNYPNLISACIGLAQTKGINGFYAGWWPGLVGKIPSYALTWTFFQQLKNIRSNISARPIATDAENSVMGCIASAATVCLMIPMDTIKTRLVSQAGRATSDQAYKGIIDCAVRVFREEGAITFYRGLPPRLVSVVPMIAIQFTVYEYMKRVMIQRRIVKEEVKSMKKHNRQQSTYDGETLLEEAMMGVAASQAHPNPVPRFSKPLLDSATK